jgi:nucleobase:cation symporter-1, NCS1 family
VAFLASSTFATSFTNYMNSFVIWTAAWGAIIIIDYFVINRGQTDLEALYDDPQTSRYGDIRWPALFALFVGLVAGWAFEYGSASLFQGRLSRATNGVDFSWLAAIVASGAVYYVLARTRQSPVTTGPAVDERPRTGSVQP